MRNTLNLQPGQMGLGDLRTVWQQSVTVTLDPKALPAIEASAAAIDAIVDKGDAA